MDRIIVAAAQIGSVKGDIEANIITHKKYIDIAIANNVDFIIFPELSLTDYAPELAERLKLSINDTRLSTFRKLAQDNNITIAIGAPLINRKEDKPYIGLLIYTPNNYETYAKQYLHAGEESCFASGNEGYVVDVEDITIGVAICADITHPEHARDAAEKGAKIYTAGVLISESGYTVDTGLLKQYAKEHKMAVAMAYYSSSNYSMKPAGKSAFWDENGQLVVKAEGMENALVIAKQENNVWTGNVIRI